MTTASGIADGPLSFVLGDERIGAQFESGRLHLAKPVPAGHLAFQLLRKLRGSELSFALSGQVAGGGTVVDLDAPSATIADALAGGRLIDLSVLRTSGGVPVARTGTARATALLFALSAVLAAYVGTRLYSNTTTITPAYAYIASDVQAIASPTSGTVAFITDNPSPAIGEPIFALETARGKTVFVDATEERQLVSAEVEIGARVRRGDPVLVVATDDPAVHVRALVTREQAEQLRRGAVARYEVLDTDGVHAEVALDAAAIRLRSLPESGAHALPPMIEVQFTVPDDGTSYRNAPIRLVFSQTLTGRATAALDSAGMPAIVTAVLLQPLAWLSAFSGREV